MSKPASYLVTAIVIAAIAAWMQFSNGAPRQPVAVQVQAEQLVAMVSMASGELNRVTDLEEAMTPQAQLAGTNLENGQVSLLCSRRWPGTLAYIDGTMIGLNAEALRAVAAGIIIERGGEKLRVIRHDDDSSPLANDPVAAAALSERADKRCRPAAMDRDPGRDPMTDAYALCAMLDGRGLTTEPCEVSGWNKSVRATMNISAASAKTICRDLVEILQTNRATFKPGWKIEIYSPYSGGNSIAFCDI